jgi:hypothetical protein
MSRPDRIRHPQPLIGLLLVSAGWALSHQVGSDGVFDDCLRRGNGFAVAVSLIGLLIVALGGFNGWRAWQPRDPESGRSALGIVVALLALLGGFAVILQIAAGLILPPCFA